MSRERNMQREKRSWYCYVDSSIEPEDDFLEYYKKQLAVAIKLNDVIGLKNLLSTYGGIGLVDRYGRSLLTWAIDCYSDVLLIPDVDIDAQYCDFNGIEETALILSLRQRRENFAMALIKKGANIHLEQALCLAVQKQYLEICVLLIEKGVDINRCDSNGHTPFNRACAEDWTEGICMLLYYGVDVNSGSICDRGIYKRAKSEIKEILFDYIYDEIEAPRRFTEFMNIVYFHDSFVGRFLECTSEIIYDYVSWPFDSDLGGLLLRLEPKYFQILTTKFESFVKSVILHSQSFVFLSRALGADVKRTAVNITILLNSNLSHHLIGRINGDRGSKFRIGDYFHPFNLPLDRSNPTEVINVFSRLLSNGLNVSMRDVNEVYYRFGFSPLFKQIIYMDIQSETEKRPNDVMPVLICSVGTTLKSILQDMKKEQTEMYKWSHLYKLYSICAALDYFCDDELKEFCSTLDDKRKRVQQKLKQLPRVPLLLELARNTARKHIVLSYGVETFRHFSEILNRLKLASVYKEILTYEMKLYRQM